MLQDIVVTYHSRDQYDTREYLSACVDSVVKNTSNFKFVFVDDFSDEVGRERIQQVANQFPNSYLVRTHKQRWFTRAVNLGLRMVRSPWVVILNSDCVVDPGWLTEMYEVRDEIERTVGKVGLVGSLMSTEEPRRYEVTNGAGYVTGHCYLASMQALYEASAARGMPGWYLDETTEKSIHIFSDNEICYLLNRLGYQTVLSFKSNVGHHGGKSWGHDLSRASAWRFDLVND